MSFSVVWRFVLTIAPTRYLATHSCDGEQAKVYNSFRNRNETAFRAHTSRVYVGNMDGSRYYVALSLEAQIVEVRF